jgi:HEAT repeat protein
MDFYKLSKPERVKLVSEMKETLLHEIKSGKFRTTFQFFCDDDTYIRKSAYLAIGRIYFDQNHLQKKITRLLFRLVKETDFKIRQTAINAAGEIGKKDFETVEKLFDIGLLDAHHAVRNAVIGSLKKMGDVNPRPVLQWAKNYLHHPDKEIRREICHGIELRGRKHPQDILPLLKELQFDKTSRVRNTLVHVLGQIAYKKGCLEKVIAHLKTWQNKELVAGAIDEIIDVHERYKNFAFYTQRQAKQFIKLHYHSLA